MLDLTLLLLGRRPWQGVLDVGPSHPQQLHQLGLMQAQGNLQGFCDSRADAGAVDAAAQGPIGGGWEERICQGILRTHRSCDHLDTRHASSADLRQSSLHTVYARLLYTSKE